MKKGLNSNQIKLIACITMLIDHIGAGIIITYVLGNQYLSNPAVASMNWYLIYRVMRYIGRMAFPIYCYFIVEGFYHTSSRKKYALRLFTLALISEVPFDFALRENSFWDFSSNNVFWTLLLGLLCIWSIDEVRNKLLSDDIVDKVKTIIINTLIIVGFISIGYILNVDYSKSGVATIVAMYFLFTNRLVAFAAGVLILAAASSSSEIFALLMLIPMYFYNGERGKKTKAIQWGFYLFYPVHLTIIGLVLKFFY